MKILPEALSTYAADIDGLITTITYFVVVWFIIAFVALILGVLSNLKKEGGKAKYIPGIGWAQTKVILIPLILVVLSDFYIDIATTKVWSKVEVNIPKTGDVEVKVHGMQFDWMFNYPGPDKLLGTADDVTGVPVLVLPENKTALLHLTSVDVLHAFFVPEWRMKNDVIPGRVITRWVNPTKTGHYSIVCVEICGPSHGYMNGSAYVVTQEEFNKFIADPNAYIEANGLKVERPSNG